jgi:predicted nuclease of predicted toxin-antitoxin system
LRLLFDENLSRKLVARLGELYPSSDNVATFDLLAHPDRDIWDFFQANEFIIVTTDGDFFMNPLRGWVGRRR